MGKYFPKYTYPQGGKSKIYAWGKYDDEERTKEKNDKKKGKGKCGRKKSALKMHLKG